MQKIELDEIPTCATCPVNKILGDHHGFGYEIEGYLEGDLESENTLLLEMYNPVDVGVYGIDIELSSRDAHDKTITEAFRNCSGPDVQKRRILPDKLSCGALRKLAEGHAENLGTEEE